MKDIDSNRIKALGTAPPDIRTSKLKMTGVVLSILMLSLAIISTSNGNSMALAQSSSPGEKVIKITGSGAKLMPSVGITNVFGTDPPGLFPKQPFTCIDPGKSTCPLDAKDAKFIGTFEKGNSNNLTSYTFNYTSPIDSRPAQIKGHTYMVKLTDLKWNGTDAAKQTPQPEFARVANNSIFNQPMHGLTNIDRKDVPQLFNKATLFGHALVKDITNGNNTVVVKSAFTHLMFMHFVDPKLYYTTLGDPAKSPDMVLVDVANFCHQDLKKGDACILPNGEHYSTPGEGQKYFPPKSARLGAPPPIKYPVNGTINAPKVVDGEWPVDNTATNNPFYFLFFIIPKPNVSYADASSMTANGGK